MKPFSDTGTVLDEIEGETRGDDLFLRRLEESLVTELTGETWFAFYRDSRPGDAVYGWGDTAEASRYLGLLNAEIEDEFQRFAMDRVTDAKRLRVIEQADEALTFNLDDHLRELAA